MNTLLEKLGDIKSNFDNELRELTLRIEKCEKHGAANSKELKLLDKKFSTELSKYHSKQEEKIPYVLMLQTETNISPDELKNLKTLNVF